MNNNEAVDAGWAGVLGATVGALGTGAAGIAAALLARSQARMQIHAEALRAIREPRKSAYVAFAETWWTRYSLLFDGWIELELAEENPDSSEYDNLIAAAREFRERVFQAAAPLEHAQAVVHVEGPPNVTGTSIDAVGALVQVVRCFHTAVGNAPNGEAFGDRKADFEAAIATAHEGYLGFLYAASAALGETPVRA
ncbi:hypothetical protein ACFXKR_04585 [Streptomyces violascens]|uniref:hypothetical protein n=1 Tax=Streptomyces violascens TaxID=67381 RepID=UPI003674F406